MNPLTALITSRTDSPAPGDIGAPTDGPSKIGQFAKLLGIGPEIDQLLTDGLPVNPLAIGSPLPQPTSLPEALAHVEELPVPLADTSISDQLLSSTGQEVETADTAPANVLSDPEIAGTILPEQAAAALANNPGSADGTASALAAVSELAIPVERAAPANPALPVIPAEPASPTQPGERDVPATPGLPATPGVPAAAAQPAVPHGSGKAETGQKTQAGQATRETGNGPTPSARTAPNAAPQPPQLDRNLPPQQPAAAVSQPVVKPQQNSESSNSPGRPVALPSADTAPGRNGSVRPIALPPQPAIATTVLNPVAGQLTLQGFEQADTGTTGPMAIEAGNTGVQMRAASPMHTGQTPQLPVNSLAVHIAQQAQNGMKRFNIRLDPPELGRMEIRLDLTRDGQVTTHLIVERAETLDLLQRDARALERALQNAGLDSSEDGLKFSLKDQGLAHDASQDRNNDSANDARNADADDGSAENEGAAHYAANYVATSGLDMRI